jgi:hypothetical protein
VLRLSLILTKSVTSRRRMSSFVKDRWEFRDECLASRTLVGQDAT